jgi:hypothetical protein
MFDPAPAAQSAQVRSWVFRHSSAQVQAAIGLAHHL